MKQFIDWLMDQSGLEKILASYSMTITVYLIVVGIIKRVKSKHFIQIHKGLFHGITLFIAAVFSIAGCFVREMVESEFLTYQVLMLVIALVLNYLIISGVSIKKLKDIEFGDEDADAIREQQEYIEASDVVSAYLRDFIVTISSITHKRAKEIRGMDFTTFNAEYNGYVNSLLGGKRNIETVEFVDLDNADTEKIKNFISDIVKTQRLWYDDSEIGHNFIRLITDLKIVDLSQNVKLIPVKTDKFFTLISLTSENDIYDFDVNFIISSYTVFCNMLR